MGNPGADKVLLTSATMADTTGTVISLQILNSTNDPNKLVQPEQAVAYPASPLQPNTQYSVNLSGTINGTPFTRSFTFTTGNIVG